MTPPLALEEAQARLLSLIHPGAPLTIPVDESHGRYLAAPLVARRSQPAADLSAMDGYATVGDGPWEVAGEARAGAPFDKAPAAGMAVRISTGAQMPVGTDAVLLQEHARIEGDRLIAEHPPESGYIRRMGLDFHSSDTLLGAGMRMGPAQIALARAGGLAEVVVHEAPRITVIEGGDELCADPADCPPGHTPAVNGTMLCAMAAEAGAAAMQIGPVADDVAQLTHAIERASADASLVIMTGGASVGPHDLVKPALEAAGFALDFWRVAIKPGKPLLVATRGDAVVLGLPGNPVSSFVPAFLFMLPAIRRLAGARDCLPRGVPMALGAPLPAGGKRREFLRASWSGDAVIAADVQDSSALLPLAHAQVLIDWPAGADAAETGAFVPCYLLESGGYA